MYLFELTEKLTLEAELLPTPHSRPKYVYNKVSYKAPVWESSSPQLCGREGREEQNSPRE